VANGHGNVNGKCNTAKAAITIPTVKWCPLIFWTNKELTFNHIHIYIIRRLISRNKGTIYSLFLISNDKNFENVNIYSNTKFQLNKKHAMYRCSRLCVRHVSKISGAL